jgi:hypothetical protein
VPLEDLQHVFRVAEDIRRPLAIRP